MIPSLIAGAILALGFGLVIVFEADLETIDWTQFLRSAFVLSGAGGLFELFLYYSFIHLRLEKAFGVLPAIVGTSVLYVTWHTGTQLPLEADPLLGAIKLFGVGLLYQSVFSTTRNVFIVWPLFHCVGVMIDFAVNLEALARPSEEFPWAVATVFSMLLVVGATVALARRRYDSARAHG